MNGSLPMANIAPAAGRIDPRSLTRKALSLQAKGDHEQALELVRLVLARYPRHAASLLVAGQSLLVLQQHDGCIEMLDALISQAPGHAMALNNRGVALEALGRLEEACDDYARAVRAEPDYEDALLNHARCLGRLQRHGPALAVYRQILAAAPNHAAAHVGVGQSLAGLGREAESIDALRAEVRARPNNGMAWYALGSAYLNFSRWAEAVDAYGQSSALLPAHAMTYANCTKALRELREYEDALLVCDAAISIDGECLPARRNKVVVLLDLGRWLWAIEACHEVLKRDPSDAQTHNNLGFALSSLHQLPAALDAFQAAARHDPKLAIAWVNQACTLEVMGRQSEVAPCYAQALELDPQHSGLLGRYGHALQYVCDWSKAQAIRDRVLKAIESGQAACDPFRIIGYSDEARHQQMAARLGAQALAPIEALPLSIQPKAPGDRLRVGYLSADFHHHATSMLMAQLLETHDAARFEIIGLSFGDPKEDAMKARLRKAFASFHDLSGMNDGEASAFCRSLGLDIAVDLKGHTMDNRIGILQRRVAPVQISYLGFPGTLGARFMDYILADRVLIPDELLNYYDEKVIRVSGTYQANDATRIVSAGRPSRQALGLPESGFVFCCFNNNYKITPEVFAVWMRLLKAVDGSVLWLLADNEQAASNLRQHAQSHAVDPGRLLFAPRMPIEEHLARQCAADLFLDTLPCNAHTTASDALRMGLPLLTCTGTAFASRVAASLLTAQGLEELVTTTLQDYERLALELATDPARLSTIRQRAEQAVAQGRLLDTDGLTREIEQAFEWVHRRQAAGLAPEHLDVQDAPASSDSRSSRAFAMT